MNISRKKYCDRDSKTYFSRFHHRGSSLYSRRNCIHAFPESTLVCKELLRENVIHSIFSVESLRVTITDACTISKIVYGTSAIDNRTFLPVRKLAGKFFRNSIDERMSFFQHRFRAILLYLFRSTPSSCRG